MDKDRLILSLKQENDALRQENLALKTRCLQDFMERAIKDDHLSQQIAPDMQQFYPNSIAPWFICILFFGSKPSLRETPVKAPLTVVSETFLDPLSHFGQPYFFEASGIVACLLNVALEDSPEQLPQAGKDFCKILCDVLSEVHQHSKQETDVSHIAISHASTLEQGPRFLYRAAVSVSERRTSDAPAVCMENEIIVPSRENLQQVFALEPLFWRQIQQHAFFDAATTMDQLILLTGLEQGSLERTLASVFSRMELVLHTAMQENGNDPMQDSVFASLMKTFSNVETYQEMREVVYDILATLEDQFYTPANTRNKKMSNIEKHILENYSDQSLGATSIAEQFKISPSYLSRIFKTDMGIGIVDYIHRIRIDAAKKLLLATDYTLDDIAVRVGFSNRWILIRVFKKLEGVTPGIYRNGPA